MEDDDLPSPGPPTYLRSAPPDPTEWFRRPPRVAPVRGVICGSRAYAATVLDHQEANAIRTFR